MNILQVKPRSAKLPAEDQLGQAVVARDRTFDGQVYFAVNTTGHLLPPLLPFSRSRRVNARFFLSCQAAEQAGFGPCKRCKPNEPALAAHHAAKVAAACREIESSGEIPNLKDMARKADFSPPAAEKLVAGGVKELLVISQDTGAYGLDLKYAESTLHERPVRANFLDLAREHGKLGVWTRMLTM